MWNFIFLKNKVFKKLNLFLKITRLTKCASKLLHIFVNIQVHGIEELVYIVGDYCWRLIVDELKENKHMFWKHGEPPFLGETLSKFL